ncbi:MAG: glutathione S-transferase [Pseudomonadota bacterium]|nr:glutathione S-transferase [Pseudomonadota bacterium]
MKLYDGGRAPNPRRVRMFLAEKGIEVPMVPVDMAKGEHWSPEIARLNPLKRLPILEFDDGSILTESMAICRYFEALHPEPNLFGEDPLEIATIEMWNRRAEFELYTAVQAVFRHGHPGMAKAEPRQIAEWADLNRDRVIEALQLLDDRLAETEYLAGTRFSVADITAFVSIELMKAIKTSVPEEMASLRRWHAAMLERPSAKA